MVREKITAEISGGQIWRYAEKIAQHNRIQASPGYRKAAEEIVSVLAGEGVDARIHSYPAHRGEGILAMQSFQDARVGGWPCRFREDVRVEQEPHGERSRGSSRCRSRSRSEPRSTGTRRRRGQIPVV